MVYVTLWFRRDKPRKCEFCGSNTIEKAGNTVTGITVYRCGVCGICYLKWTPPKTRVKI